MRYGLTVTTPPTVEPVTLARAKSFLRVDHSDDDANITAAISAARRMAEAHTGRFFLAQTVRLKFSGWPRWGNVIELTPFGADEVTAVSSITYRDVNGVTQTWAADQYQTELSSNPPVIALSPASAGWPDLEDDRLYPVTVTVTAGAADADALDPRVAQAVLLTLGYWDRDRGDAGLAEAAGSMGLPVGAKRLLDSIWTGAYG